MTITLDESYFAVADDDRLGCCGEINARELVLEGLENASADRYSMLFTYPDGVTFESTVEQGRVELTSSVMRMSGTVYAQVIACRVEGDSYVVVKKSNIIRLEIAPSLDEDAQPFPNPDDSLRILDRVISTADDLAEVSNAIIDRQEQLNDYQEEITTDQAELNARFISCLNSINQAVATAEALEQISRQNAGQILINKTAAGLEKKNLFRTLTTGATVGGVTLTVNDDGSVTLNGDVPSDTNLSIALTGAEMYDSCKHIPNGNYILCSNSNTGVIVEVTGYQFEPDGILSRAYAFAHNGEEKSFVMNDEFPYNYVGLFLESGSHFDNTVVRVMIKYQGIADSTWEPYVPSLQEQIDELRERGTSAVRRRISQAVSIAGSGTGSIAYQPTENS